ncbi:hypothetical protein VTO73DRAFT_15086 [Trametes versicolor]
MDINNGLALAKNLLDTAGLKLETTYTDRVGNSLAGRILTSSDGMAMARLVHDRQDGLSQASGSGIVEHGGTTGETSLLWPLILIWHYALALRPQIWRQLR